MKIIKAHAVIKSDGNVKQDFNGIFLIYDSEKGSLSNGEVWDEVKIHVKDRPKKKDGS